MKKTSRIFLFLIATFSFQFAIAESWQLKQPIPIPKGVADALEIKPLSNEKDWRIISFGYVNCSDLCPITLANLSKIINQANKASINVEGLFVTLDTDRDSEKKLKEHVAKYNSQIDYRRPTFKQLNEILKRFFSVEYQTFNKRKGNENYIIDHSTTAFLINKNNELVAAFDSNKNTDDVLKIISQFSGKQA